jgi:hypothetical protein
VWSVFADRREQIGASAAHWRCPIGTAVVIRAIENATGGRVSPKSCGVSCPSGSEGGRPHLAQLSSSGGRA